MSDNRVRYSFNLGTISTSDSIRQLFRADRQYILRRVWMGTGATIDDHVTATRIDFTLVDQTNSKTLTSTLTTDKGLALQSFEAYVDQEAAVVYGSIPIGASVVLNCDVTGSLAGLDAVTEFKVYVELEPISPTT